MKRSTLRSLIRAHYRSASLPAETVTKWIASPVVEVASDRQPRRAMIPRRWMVGAVSLAAIAVLVWAALRSETASTSTLARTVAAEVAANHAKLRPLDVQASTYSELRRVMDRFEFTLVEPQHASCAGLTLDGARYCSIQDRPAAQIRLHDSRGEVFTLYETRDDASLAAIAETEILVDGSSVRLWRGDGLFFALASAAH